MNVRRNLSITGKVEVLFVFVLVKDTVGLEDAVDWGEKCGYEHVQE